MATISAFTTLLPLAKIKFCAKPSSPPSVSVPCRSLGLKIDAFNNGFERLKVKSVRELRKRRAVEEDTQLTEEGVATTSSSSSVAVEQEQPAVAIPVSPSDKLSMFFQAEGQMSDAAIPTVTKALEGTEGITNLKVDISEGIASVELMKQTTIQATGVASSLVETIQGAGFKLQTLNLSFEEEEEVMV